MKVQKKIDVILTGDTEEIGIVWQRDRRKMLSDA